MVVPPDIIHLRLGFSILNHPAIRGNSLTIETSTANLRDAPPVVNGQQHLQKPRLRRGCSHICGPMRPSLIRTEDDGNETSSVAFNQRLMDPKTYEDQSIWQAKLRRTLKTFHQCMRTISQKNPHLHAAIWIIHNSRFKVIVSFFQRFHANDFRSSCLNMYTLIYVCIYIYTHCE